MKSWLAVQLDRALTGKRSQGLRLSVVQHSDPHLAGERLENVRPLEASAVRTRVDLRRPAKIAFHSAQAEELGP